MLTKRYKTKQRALIEEILKSSGGKHFTVEDIANELKTRRENVGTTTIYRTLEKLVSENTVQKYFVQTGHSACYRYVTDAVCNEHFHLKCTRCGRLIHIECEELQDLADHIKSNHSFQLDNLKTVLYGVCEDCLKV